MTPEYYAERRLQILEQVTRDLMLVVLEAHPMAGRFINAIGQKWDQALDRLDSERAAIDSAVTEDPASASEGETK